MPLDGDKLHLMIEKELQQELWKREDKVSERSEHSPNRKAERKRRERYHRDSGVARRIDN